MKIKRKKVVGRVLTFFEQHYGFHEPYQVLLDGTYCHAALKARVDLLHQVPMLLGSTKLLTTVCAVRETETLGHGLYGAMLVIKQYPVHKCGHEKSPLSAKECLLSMIGKKNENHYIIASQDDDLRLHVSASILAKIEAFHIRSEIQPKLARQVAGTPIMYFNYDTPVMERPSKVSVTIGNKIAKRRSGITSREKSVIRTMKKKFDLVKPDTPVKNKKKKRQKNALSCLKKKKKVVEEYVNKELNSEEGKRKRRRVRVKVAKHVKEHFSVGTSNNVAE